MTERRILPEYEHVGDRELSEAIYQALGTASVCWKPMDCTGVFDEATASQLGAELLEIARRYEAHPLLVLEVEDGKVTKISRVLDGPAHPGYALPEAASEGDSQ